MDGRPTSYEWIQKRSLTWHDLETEDESIHYPGRNTPTKSHKLPSYCDPTSICRISLSIARARHDKRTVKASTQSHRICTADDILPPGQDDHSIESVFVAIVSCPIVLPK